MRLLEVLGAEHEVALVTTGEVDWGALNALAGTRVEAGAVRVLRPWLPPGVRGSGLGAAARAALHQRFARWVAPRFDVCVSAYNPVDFGRPAVQVVGDFSWDPALARRYDPAPPGWRGRFAASAVAQRAYRAVVGRIGAPSGRGAIGPGDVVLANSRFVAEVLRERYGVEAPVVYPPVARVAGEGAPWEARAARFVALGRIAPEKRIGRLVRIVAGVRARGHAVTLAIAGAVGDDAYGREIARRVAAAGAWVSLVGPVYGAAKAALLAESRYGLHGREGEPFGIAVAELAAAGCVPFVPACGGAAEIVGDAALTYGDEADAVARIDAFLRREAVEQAAVGARLAAGAGRVEGEGVAAGGRRGISVVVG